MRGRPPKPTALKILEGNRGKRAIVPEMQPTRGAPKCPSHLDPVAKRAWRNIAPELDRLGILARVDGMALEGACVAYSRAIAADQVLAAQGLTMKTQTGYEAQRPEVAISHNSWRRFKEFCTEFGLTPSSRSRIRVGNTGPEIDPLEALLA